jgi:hypothetical protein
MQLKPITAIIVLSLVVASLLVSGCTTSNTSTATPTATPTAQGAQATPGADNLAGAMTAYYKEQNYTVNTPFKMTKSGDTLTYTGVVTDGSKVLTPYKRNITIVLTPTRTSAGTIYQTAINTQKAQGYQEYLKTNYSSYSYWIGVLGATSSSSNPSNRVFDMLNEPASYGTLKLPDSSGFSNGYIYANTKDYFEVITDVSTLAA